jgi:hypothetical protein
MYHPGEMYNRPICGRSTGAYTNLGDLQRDLMGVKFHPTKKKVYWLNFRTSFIVPSFIKRNVSETGFCHLPRAKNLLSGAKIDGIQPPNMVLNLKKNLGKINRLVLFHTIRTTWKTKKKRIKIDI